MSNWLGRLALFGVAVVGAGLLNWLLSPDVDQEREEPLQKADSRVRRQTSYRDDYSTTQGRDDGSRDHYGRHNISNLHDLAKRSHRTWVEVEDNDISYDDGYSRRRISNPQNNHDHLKKRHRTKAAAEDEVRRMQMQRVDGYERLNAYYNEDYECWFVGRSKW
jgi:hypothetical protein